MVFSLYSLGILCKCIVKNVKGNIIVRNCITIVRNELNPK